MPAATAQICPSQADDRYLSSRSRLLWRRGPRFHRCWLMSQGISHRGGGMTGDGRYKTSGSVTDQRVGAAPKCSRPQTGPAWVFLPPPPSENQEETQSLPPSCAARSGSRPTAVTLRTVACPIRSGCPAHRPSGGRLVLPPWASPADPGWAACVWSRWEGGPSRLHAGLAWLEQGKLSQNHPCGNQWEGCTLSLFIP